MRNLERREESSKQHVRSRDAVKGKYAQGAKRQPKGGAPGTSNTRLRYTSERGRRLSPRFYASLLVSPSLIRFSLSPSVRRHPLSFSLDSLSLHLPSRRVLRLFLYSFLNSLPGPPRRADPRPARSGVLSSFAAPSCLTFPSFSVTGVYIPPALVRKLGPRRGAPFCIVNPATGPVYELFVD